MFAGRAETLAKLIRSIEDQKLHVVLYGDRGIGKTSLLHILSQQARQARYLVQYLSCGEDSDFSETFRSVAASIPLLYHSDFAPTADETEHGATLGSLLPAGPLHAQQISDLFAKLTGTRLLIILDEFDRSAPGPFRRQIAELVKNLSDRSIRAQLVIAGVASNLSELIEHIPSIRRNILGLQVPDMARDEVENMIRIGERESGMSFADDAIELVTSAASGSPYIASLLSQHAAISAVERASLRVEHEDAVRSVDRAVSEIGNRLSEASRDEIRRAQTEGFGEALGILGRTALHTGGRFVGEGLEQWLPEPEARARLISEITQRYSLVMDVAGSDSYTYRFREEGAPIYLWMVLVRDRLNASIRIAQ